MNTVRPGITLWEASAGTGKTFRIAQTVLRLVADDGVPVARVAVVTFTNAAAAELRDRVRARLRDALRGLEDARWTSPDDVLGAFVAERRGRPEVAARLRAALAGYDEAPIHTIHGFCGDVLLRHAFESGAGFGAELIGSSHDLLDELVRDHWANLSAELPPVLLAVLRAGKVAPADLGDLARKAAAPDREVVPGPIAVPDVDLGPWERALDAAAAAWDGEALTRLLIDNPNLAKAASKDKGIPYGYPDKGTAETLRSAETLLRRRVPPPALGALLRLTTANVRAATKPGKASPTHPFLDAFDAVARAHDALRPVLDAFVLAQRQRFVRWVREQLPERTVARGLHTWDDLLRLVRDALADPDRGPRLTRALRARFDVALIDEFQDTDPVQWAVFHAVFADRLVLVGDPKQAIYAFRGADIFAYHQARAEVAHEEPLGVNFRSDPRLVSAVNHLFSRFDDAFLSDTIEFHEVAARHAAGRLVGDDRPPLEIRFLPRPEPGKWIGVGWCDARLPRVVAADVCAELRRGGRLGDEPVGPRHCAVLVRKNAEALAMQRALHDAGVPAVVRLDRSVFGDDEAPGVEKTELERVLAALVDPGSAGEIRSALATRMLGWTANDLDDLDRDERRFDEVAARFRRWAETWLDRGFVQAFDAVLHEERVLPRLLSQPGGERYATNLAHLVQLLHEAGQALRLGPEGLLRWLRDGGPTADDDAKGLRLESDAPAVTVVTVHSAKGLEYPLVWLPALWRKRLVLRLDKQHLVFHDPHDGHREKLDVGSDDLDAHVAQREREQLEEDLRLAYVALTRARHRCVVYWGGVEGESAMGFLLHQRGAGDPHARAVSAWERMKDDDRIREDLEDLARHPDVALSTVDWDARPEPPALPPDDAPLAARPLSRPGLDPSWRRASFSSLTRDAHDDAPPQDHDDAPEGVSAAVGEPVRMADVPGGARVGNLVHALLERHDFQRPEALRPAVDEALAAGGFDPAWAEPLAATLRDAVDTPLDDGFRLADVRWGERWNELAFDLPVAGGLTPEGHRVTARRLAEAFDGEVGPGVPAGWSDRVRALGFGPLRGFLTGSIDLVFRHDGRFFLADYKSNKLGAAVPDYARERLGAHMTRARYVLQYHLYALALHRTLRWRLAGYDYDAHFGGVYYLFVRGMAPHRGPGHGVFHDRPPRALIERLDALFDGRAP